MPDRFQQAAESGGTVKQLEDIDGLGDVVRWASYSAGTILPSIATSVVGGGVAVQPRNLQLKSESRTRSEKK